MKNKIFAAMSMLSFGFLSGCAGELPANLGVINGRLNSCPSSPNCVSSQAAPDDKRHFIDPIAYTGEKQEAFHTLLEIIQSMERTKITMSADSYLRAEFSSSLMGFVDDVEFYFPEQPLIHIRSASRKGYGDLGVNRKRVERIRALFEGVFAGDNQ